MNNKKAKRIYETLKDNKRACKYPSTQKDLAKECNVSLTALNNALSYGIKEHILDKAMECLGI